MCFGFSTRFCLFNLLLPFHSSFSPAGGNPDARRSRGRRRSRWCFKPHYGVTALIVQLRRTKIRRLCRHILCRNDETKSVLFDSRIRLCRTTRQSSVAPFGFSPAFVACPPVEAWCRWAELPRCRRPRPVAAGRCVRVLRIASPARAAWHD